MLDIHALEKDTLHDIMLQQLYSFNYIWMRFEIFIAMKDPDEYGSEEYYQLHEDFGAYQARRLARVLGTPGEGIGELTRFLKHSHWAAFEDIEVVDLTADSFTMRTLDCSVQRAAKKWGAQHYDCGKGGLRVRTGFFKGINPGAKVQRVFTPPEVGSEGIPANVSCEWLVSIE